MEPIKLVLVSVGSLVGQNLLEIIQEARGSFQLTGTNSLDSFHTKPLLDEFFQSPLSNTPEFEDFLERLILALQPDIVVPCRDEEVVVLARLAEKHPQWRSKISLTDSELALHFLDKYKSAELCTELDLPFVKTVPLDEFSTQLEFPMIAKPREGFASNGVRIIYASHQLDALRCARDAFILQEYLTEDPSVFSSAMNFGQEGFPLHFSFEENKYSIQLHIASKLSASSYFVGLHRMKNGISYDVRRIDEKSLEEIAQESLQKFYEIGFRGPLNLQLQRGKSGAFKIFEFNCRFTGATSARYFLGYNELELLLKDMIGQAPFGPSLSGNSSAKKIPQTIGIKA